MLKQILSRAVFFLALTLSLAAHAQVYPVSGSSVLIPPYSVYLADYTEATSDRIVLTVVLNDVARPELRVRLRAKIIGQNVTLETKPEYTGREIVLEGGVPLRLTGSDLAEYFDPNNLNFTGISRREFEKTGALPQGFYQFCFEVLEYNRGVKISNSICAPGWLILNDPPLINLPRNGDKVVATQPQNVIFQWTPRHTGSPNSAFTTEYDVKLVELWPANRNPNDAILTSPPILEETTRSTTFIYDVSQTPLELGRKYALQVKAKSLAGVDELDLFKNNGRSEVIAFTYGDACTVPQNIFAQATSATRFTAKWTGDFNHTGYSLRYRLADSPSAPWYTSTTLVPDAAITGLQPNTTYEVQVAGGCGVFESLYTGVARIKTFDTSEQGYSCGMPLEQFNLDPANLLDALKVGDVIQAGDFDVKIAKVSGGNGTFSGEGVIEVPFFNKASVKAEFASIVVTKEYRMVNGYLNVTGAGVEVIPSGVMNMMDELDEVLNALDTALANAEANRPQPFDPNAFVPDVTIKVPGPVTIDKSADGVVVTDATGKKTTIPPGTEAVVMDDQGNATFIDSKGKQHAATTAQAVAAANREYNVTLTFNNATNSRFGIDRLEENESAELKPLYKDKLDNEYYVPYKSIEAGQTDQVLAELGDGSPDKSKIRFEMGGLPVSAAPFSGNQTSFAVPGRVAGEQEALIAIFSPSDTAKKDQVLGRVNVVTYNKINKNVVIIPVNGNTFTTGEGDALQTELNRIYSQGVVGWSVTVKPGIQVEGINPFDAGSSGLLSNYTGHMKDVINAYKDNMKDGDDFYYLFLVNNPSNPEIAGFMPRSKQAGFIFKDKTGSGPAFARTIAHELGHGAFNLHHIFMEENFKVTKKTTDNLMDYNDGDKLYKYQWDMMRYPPIVIGLMEDDAEGQAEAADHICQVNVKSLASDIKDAKAKNNSIFNLDLKKYLIFCLDDLKLEDLKYLVTGEADPNKVIGDFDVIYTKFFMKDVIIENPLAQPKRILINGQEVRVKLREIINGVIDLNTLSVSKEIGYAHVTYSVNFKTSPNDEKPSLVLELDDLDHIKILLDFMGYDGSSIRERLANELINLAKSQSSNCDVIDIVFEKLPLDIIRNKLTYEEKIGFLKTLASCNVDEFGSNEELATLGLLRAIEEGKSTEFITLLRGKFLHDLDFRMDGDNHLLFSIEISKHFIRASPLTLEDQNDALRSRCVIGDQNFCYNFNFEFRNRFLQKDERYKVFFNTAHKLLVDIENDWLNDESLRLPEALDPLTYVSISLDESSAKELGISQEIQFIPAIFFRAVALRQNFASFKAGVKNGVTAGLLLAGGVSASAARGLIGETLFYADIILPAVDLLITSTDFGTDPAYKDFVDVYTAIYSGYAVASMIRLTSPAFQAKAEQSIIFWKANKSKFTTLSSSQRAQIDNAFIKIEQNIGAVSSLIDDVLLNALKNHPRFEEALSLTVAQLDDFKILLNSKVPDQASQIFTGLKSHLDAGTSFLNMQQMINPLKSNWANFSDGSKWVFRYTTSTKGLSTFGGKEIRFELPTETEFGKRIIDVVDATDPTRLLYYEFKSVNTPFNTTYATQFIRDLSNAKSIDQIKWLYDGVKTPNLVKSDLIAFLKEKNSFNSVEVRTIFSEYAESLGKPSITNQTQLENFLVTNNDWFNEIFLVVE